MGIRAATGNGLIAGSSDADVATESVPPDRHPLPLAQHRATAPDGVDSRDAFAPLTIPSLWLFGGEDNSIPTVKSGGPGGASAGRATGNGALLPRVAPESWPEHLNWLAKEDADSVP